MVNMIWSFDMVNMYLTKFTNTFQLIERWDFHIGHGTITSTLFRIEFCCCRETNLFEHFAKTSINNCVILSREKASSCHEAILKEIIHFLHSRTNAKTIICLSGLKKISCSFLLHKKLTCKMIFSIR